MTCIFIWGSNAIENFLSLTSFPSKMGSWRKLQTKTGVFRDGDRNLFVKA